MKLCFHALRDSSGNLAILSAIRRASSLVSSLALRGDRVRVHNHRTATSRGSTGVNDRSSFPRSLNAPFK
jgi:hypothetical protein